MERETPFFKLGLIGFPLEKSLSPAIHKTGLAELGLNGDYLLFPVPQMAGEDPGLAWHVNRLRSGDLHGLNVTLPHKTTILAHLDGLTPLAQAIGAVNTIYLRDGLVVGDNTDVLGFMRDLERLTGLPAAGVRGAPSPGFGLVLGSGGAARAVSYGLWNAGWKVVVAARRIDPIGPWVQALQTVGSSAEHPGSISAITLDRTSLRQVTAEGQHHPFLLLVNATSVGMLPNPQANPWPEELPLPRRAFIYDLVYKPLETRLIQAARQAGLAAANGLGMLVEQAALSFELWTGREAPRSAMRQAVGLSPSGASEKRHHPLPANGDQP